MQAIVTAWHLLEQAERRSFWILIFILVMSAMTEMAMVGSIVPFLSAIAAPDRSFAFGGVEDTLVGWGVERGDSLLLALGLIALGAIGAAGLFSFLRSYVLYTFTGRLGLAVSTRLMATYLRQPYEFFLHRHTGELSNLVLSEATQVIDQFYLPACQGIAALCTILALVALVFHISPVTALVCLTVMGGIYALAYWLSSRTIARIGKVRVEASAQRSLTVLEAFGGIKTLKLTGSETNHLHLYESSAARVARATSAANTISEAPRALVQTVAFSGIILLALFTILSQQDGDGIATFLPILGAFAFAGQRLLPALGQVYSSFMRMRYGTIVLERLRRDLEQSPGLPPLSGPRDDSDRLHLRDSLRLDGVGFRFAGAETASLTDITMTIRAGERIGIVGSTGAGKTTLMDVILGLLPPQHGKIFVDGIPLDTPERSRQWRRMLGYVPQDIFLMNGTILANIAFGEAEGRIDRARAIDCARLAQIANFVTNHLPQGFETCVGERGVRLSGGQKQRIGIARALYADAELLVFDEATSALDGVTEAEVMSAIEALPQTQTVLLVAHRLSTLRGCDRIAVLEQGCLVAFDTWANLAQSSPTFATMLRAAELAKVG